MAIFGRTKGSFGIDPETQQAVNQYASMPAPVQQAQPSKLDKWINAFQGVGAALRDDPNIYESYQNRQAAQQQFQMRRQDQLTDYQRRIEDERNNWLFQQQYKSEHPAPSDDAFTRAMAAAGIQQGTPEYQSMARQRAQMLTQPVQLMPDGMGGYTAVRPNAPPSAPVGALTPIDPSELGGPTQGASGNFSIPSGNPLVPFRR